MHRQPERLHAQAHFAQKSFSIGQQLESQHNVIGVSNHNHVPASLAVAPLLHPQVKDVMQINVGQQRGYYRPLGRARFGLR
jgi:hypothetical protein